MLLDCSSMVCLADSNGLSYAVGLVDMQRCVLHSALKA